MKLGPHKDNISGFVFNVFYNFPRYSSMKDENIFMAEKLKTDVRKSENVKVSVVGFFTQTSGL